MPRNPNKPSQRPEIYRLGTRVVVEGVLPDGRPANSDKIIAIFLEPADARAWVKTPSARKRGARVRA